ncbi:MAG: hypothetical protein ACRDJC_11570 [Thermomicrobiales bacterium]
MAQAGGFWSRDSKIERGREAAKKKRDAKTKEDHRKLENRQQKAARTTSEPEAALAEELAA